MEPENEGTGAWGLSSSNARAIAAFATGFLAGGVLAVGVLLISRAAIRHQESAKLPPRRLRIGNLEIEERGEDTQFYVQ